MRWKRLPSKASTSPCIEVAKCGLSRLETKTVTTEERPDRKAEAKLFTT